MPTPRKDFAIAFWDKVDMTAGPDGCWLWMGATKSNGYGNYSESGQHGKTLIAHRVAWTLTHGPIEPDVMVLHKCDVRACVNPRHLFAGEAADNTADMIAKGRARPPRHKLTDERVSELKADVRDGLSMTKAGKKHGVSTEMVSRIMACKAWAHVL